jgi:hypothetical protein
MIDGENPDLIFLFKKYIGKFHCYKPPLKKYAIVYTKSEIRGNLFFIKRKLLFVPIPDKLKRSTPLT